MEKRLFMAMVLSVGFLLLWSVIMPKPQPARLAEKPQVSSQKAVLPTETPKTAQPEKTVTYANEEYEATFNENTAAIKSISFKNYPGSRFLLHNAFMLGDENLIFQNISQSAEQVSFIHKSSNEQIVKRYIFHKHNYAIDLEIEYTNLSTGPIEINYPLFLGSVNFAEDPNESRYKDVTISVPGKNIRPNIHKDLVVNQPNFIGLRDRYFCNILGVAPNERDAFIKKINNNETEIGVSGKTMQLATGKTLKQNFSIYLGPQDLGLINQINPSWTAIIHFGAFDFIAWIILQLLAFFYKIGHNWGLAIIILSVAIYFILFPLTLKQMRSMKKMQSLQPRLDELKILHKDNPQKFYKEQMGLYKEHKVNPFSSGCLPLLLQAPIFLALFQVLSRSIVLKGASFLWIKDLASPDQLITLSSALPLIGKQINLLPILTALAMFVQQKMSLAKASGEYAEQQKMMLFLMPILFGFIFYSMPAGLVLYWLINSILMLSFQWNLNRIK